MQNRVILKSLTLRFESSVNPRRGLSGGNLKSNAGRQLLWILERGNKQLIPLQNSIPAERQEVPLMFLLPAIQLSNIAPAVY